MVYFFFFFPLGTDVERRRAPLVTLTLCLLNVVIYLALHHVTPLRPWFWRLAMVPAVPQIHTALTACFLHAGLMHLGGNMLYLWLFGAPLEDRLGRWRFLVIYLLAGSASLYLQAGVILLVSPAYAVYPIVGASGAVAALLGAFLVRLPYARVRIASVVLFMLHGVNRANIRTLNSAAAIVLWMLLQIVYGLVSTGSGPGVAYWAHLGGMLLGVGLALTLGARRTARADLHWLRGERYMATGAWFAAAGEFEAAVRMRPDDPAGLRGHARALVAAGARRQALQRFERAIESCVERDDWGEAMTAYREMDRLLPGAVLAPERQLQIAERLMDDGEYEAATTALEDFTRAYPDHEQAEFARLLVAEVQGTLLGDRADALRRWRELDPRLLPPGWRRHLAKRLRRRPAA